MKYLVYLLMNKEIKNKAVPELRFPEFKNAEDWKIEPFGEVYSFKSTNSFTRDNLNYVSGSVKNIHYGDIHTKFSTLFDISKEIVPFINSSISIENINEELYCIEGDIIFADASEDLKDVGKSIEVIYLNDEKLLSGMHTLLARQKEPKLVVGFGGHLFMCNSIRAQIQRESQGAKVLGISATRLSNVSIYYPPNHSEQQKIADCLSSLDELITAQNEKLDVLNDHKKGLMQLIFPGASGTVQKLRFKEFEDSGNWKEKTLDQISSSIFDGTHQTPKYTEDGVPFFSVENIVSGNKNKFISQKDYLIATSKNKPEKGDILITRIGNIGFSKVVDWDYEFSIYVTLAVVKKSEQFVSNYLHSFFQSNYYQSEIGSKSLWSAVPCKINMDELRKTKVLLPPDEEKKEQQKIADCFSSIDELIEVQTKKIEVLSKHKEGLMQQLFPVINKNI